ncbi:MltA domain-containing protein [Wielerella bovis]|uniref:murein transglycosylase A n=1 Tax=Wielerella bovis TaxID=2917790 RepID=UPI0020191775|nr:MltA domain-containing protein [Wielerella bovis]ULJ69432.1 MltA domain-containing protein [Wielerella bovis]
MSRVSKRCFSYLILSTLLTLTACANDPVASVPNYATLPVNAMPAGTPAPYGLVHTPSNSNTQYRVASFAELPEWYAQPFSGSLKSFKNSCLKLVEQAQWQYVCARAAQTPDTDLAAKNFFEQFFTPWQVSTNGQLGGKVTGYYEPVLQGNVQSTTTARFPIYGIPMDLVSVPLPNNLRNSKGVVRINPTTANMGAIQSNGAYTANLAQFPVETRGSVLKGRFVGKQFVPYFTRAEINAGALTGRAPILGYANDPVELFFLHVQGSGRLVTPTGQMVRLGFADANGLPYRSIGQYMARKNYLPLAQTSMQGIKTWINANPLHLAEVLGQNPRYVFFRVLDGSPEQGPIGAMGVPLTAGFSGAVDKRFITLGTPLFLATTHPDNPKVGLNRLLVAQDSGAAIKGAVRVDYFWGYGEAAGQTAGKQNATGYVWQLLPHGVMPTYRP